MLSAATGITPSALMAEPAEYLDALAAVVFKREDSRPELDPSGLAARMAGRG